MNYKSIKVSTPGRICLFGEHQDYLGLPVIAAAISKRIEIVGSTQHSSNVQIHLPDINTEESFELQSIRSYQKDRDYFRSVFNILERKKGITFPEGFDITVQGNIPINSGTSSSSALVVAWTHFLLKMAGQPIDPIEVGELAYLAEVEEFGEPGGRMDQYATAIGHIMYLESSPKIQVKAYNPAFGSFVLGDSLEPKDTLKVLKHVKFGMLEALQKIKNYNPNFDLSTAPIESAHDYRSILNTDEFILFHSNLSDRDILRKAQNMFENQELDNVYFGTLLNQHQDNLRDAKRVSTDKINRMIHVANNAGALGGKINGSGGGGCMFAYTPNNPEAVVEAIEKVGGKAYIIDIAEGSTDFTLN